MKKSILKKDGATVIAEEIERRVRYIEALERHKNELLQLTREQFNLRKRQLEVQELIKLEKVKQHELLGELKQIIEQRYKSQQN